MSGLEASFPRELSGLRSLLVPRSDPLPMGRTLENKQQIVEELKGLLGEAEMALVLDFKGLTIKEMTDLRTRLQASNGVCKVTKNTLMRRAIDGDSVWSDLDSLLTGTNAFVLVKGDIGGAVKALQSFQKDTKKSDVKEAFSKASSFPLRHPGHRGSALQGGAHGPDRRCDQWPGHQAGCGHQRGSVRSRQGAQATRRIRRRLSSPFANPWAPPILPFCC